MYKNQDRGTGRAGYWIIEKQGYQNGRFFTYYNRTDNKNTKYVFVCINDKGVLSVVAFGTPFLLKEEENG